MKRYTTLKRYRSFGAIRVFDGRDHYDSKSEHARWLFLQTLEKGGTISALILKPKVILVPRNGTAPEIRWEVDYSYIQDGRRVWEDWKPRPFTDKERLLFKLWKHFGPGLLVITHTQKGRYCTRKQVMPAGHNET
uniref:Uncharacterized protein n=1 Tax=viral metagenome TaxID=1070528 RepID=A0A6M3JNV6_9ZZZZ